jgi:hypothetical protein
VGTGKTLMLVAEILAVTAVAVQFLLPGEVGIVLHIGHKVLGLPIRWVVPLLLISLAGALSMVVLFTLYWRLAHVSIPVARQC